jgi:hypothetical protein
MSVAMEEPVELPVEVVVEEPEEHVHCCEHPCVCG